MEAVASQMYQSLGIDPRHCHGYNSRCRGKRETTGPHSANVCMANREIVHDWRVTLSATSSKQEQTHANSDASRVTHNVSDLDLGVNANPGHLSAPSASPLLAESRVEYEVPTLERPTSAVFL